MIKRLFLTWAAVACLFSPLPASLRLEAGNGAAVEIRARTLKPGEVFLAVFHPSGEGQGAEVEFLGKSYVFSPGGPGGKPFALLGVDFRTRPGSYKIEVRVTDRSGGGERIQRYLRLHPKSFSRKEFKVDERLVTPPPEVEDRLAREREILSRVYRSSGNAYLGRGSYVLPHSGKPTPNFGEFRVYNGIPRSRHTGVDISGAEGSEVKASNAGLVALAMELYFSGNTVILDHGLGIFTVYCHCSRLNVREGMTVGRGDVIALVGSTGRSTGPHLHWSVRIQGSAVDPLSLLSLALE